MLITSSYGIYYWPFESAYYFDLKPGTNLTEVCAKSQRFPYCCGTGLEPDPVNGTTASCIEYIVPSGPGGLNSAD
jgi:hypothetical protein